MYVCHVCHDVFGVCGEDRQAGHGVRGGYVESEREEGGKTTLTQYEPIMQASELLAHDRNDPTASFPFFSCLRHTFIFSEVQR